MPTNTPPFEPRSGIDDEDLFADEVSPVHASASVVRFSTSPDQALSPLPGTFVVQGVLPNAGIAPLPATSQGISFVICSIDDAKFRFINKRLGEICTVRPAAPNWPATTPSSCATTTSTCCAAKPLPACSARASNSST